MHAVAIASTHTPDQIARQLGDIQLEFIIPILLCQNIRDNYYTKY